MRVLLTGSEGYIGAVLGPYLMRRGHDVVGLDTGFHRAGWLVNAPDGAPMWLNKDTRELTIADLDGFDAVVHLADLSNDPLGELNADLTLDINHRGTLHVAELAKEAGAGRFVFMSSCSIYGAAGEDDSTEESPVEPQTAYAKCKVLAERDLHELCDNRFSATYLRNATAFGVSPRMRFDLVVNNLAGHAWTDGVIRMESDGTPWRPLVHVRDISEAVACVLDAPLDVVHDEAFNVGDNAQNYQIREVAEIISRTFPGCELTVGDELDRIDGTTARASARSTQRCLNSAAGSTSSRVPEELLDAFRTIGLTKELFTFRGHTRVKQIKHLLETGQIDEQLFWIQASTERELPACERLGVARRRASIPRSRMSAAEELVVEPVLARLRREVCGAEPTFSSTSSSSSGTNTFGAPRSPSYFGISYSRIRWSRNVFQVSSQRRRWSWCRSCE